MCGPARLWVIWAGYVVITTTCLLALLVGTRHYINNIGQADFFFFTFFLHNISLPEFSRINANTHNTYKKRLAGYYPPAENEDKSTVAYYTETILFSDFQRQDNQKNEPNKSPYSTISPTTKSEKYNIPHASNIRGGQSNFFWVKFWNKKREPPRITLSSSHSVHAESPLHRTTLFSVYFCRVVAFLFA